MYTGLQREMMPGMGILPPFMQKLMKDAGVPDRVIQQTTQASQAVTQAGKKSIEHQREVLLPSNLTTEEQGQRLATKRRPEATIQEAKAFDEATMDLGPMPDMDFTSGKGSNKTLLIAGGLGVAALAAAFLLMD